MKTSRSILFATVLGMLPIAACSQAAPSPAESSGNTLSAMAAGPNQGRGMRRFEEVDKNSDGNVTTDEARSAAAERFAVADTNKDGVLDASEVPALAPLGGGRRGGPSVEIFDANRDGKVTVDEFTTHVVQRVTHADVDRDGVVTAQEWHAQGGRGKGGPGGGRRPDGRGRGPGRGGFGGPMNEAVFQQADADHDGRLTRAEADAYRARRFAEADTNHDGKLDQGELTAMRNAHRAERMQDRFAKLDRDGDGKLSRDEAPPRMAAMFDEVDTDRDGKLSMDEMRAFRSEGRGPGGKGPAADTNGDGTVTSEEFSAMPARWFDRVDANHDGVVTRDELRAARPGPMRR